MLKTQWKAHGYTLTPTTSVTYNGVNGQIVTVQDKDGFIAGRLFVKSGSTRKYVVDLAEHLYIITFEDVQ